jgi:UDP-N-acetylmuramoylalanine-D-glutamate ligase
VTIKAQDGTEFVEGRALEDAWITRLSRCLAKRESARVQYHDCEDSVHAAIHFARKQGVPPKRIEGVLDAFQADSRY